MTRINVVPVTELCDQHLLAEHRELTRIPNCVAKGRFNLTKKPDEYVLGTGHVKFFYDKLGFLKERYEQLCAESARRGFAVQNFWPTEPLPIELCGDYLPTLEAMTLNRARIFERIQSFTPRFTGGIDEPRT